ncbi:MAG: methyl-accepting chemotaxis protein [Deltaproteobacteria bacterium]|nr:methyl-accepting chemotaxis protein [Deltaproteobacteria bacterium]
MSMTTLAQEIRNGHLFRRFVYSLLITALAVVLVFAGAILLSLRSLGQHVETISAQMSSHAMEKDLNVAHGLLFDHQGRIAQAVTSTATRSAVIEAVARGDRAGLAAALRDLNLKQLHFLTVVDAHGRVVQRMTGDLAGDDLSAHPLVRKALLGSASSGFWAEEASVLEREQLSERAHIRLVATEHAVETKKSQEDRGLVAGGVVPIRGPGGAILGAVIGGYLHNHDYAIVDQVRHSIYKDMEDVGTATIFLDDVRVSTNVRDNNGERAVGTRVSAAVFDTVLRQGKSFRGRAFVVRDWYVSGYEPLRDVQDRTIGILYVGVLEKPFQLPYREMYAGMRNMFLGATVAAIVISSALTLLLAIELARRLTRPISLLTGTVKQLSKRDLTVEIPTPENADELGDLQTLIKDMTASLRDMVRGNREGMNVLSTSTTQIAATAKQSQATAAEQASALQEVGSTIEEIGATSKVVLEQAQEVVEASEHAVEGGQRGLQAVTEAQRGLELIGKIVEIVDNVNDLAEQSNVLAVNASIEAAKAGDRGRGFAVVAGEVRSLAGQSKKAARQIREILTRIEGSGAAISNASTVIRDLAAVLEHTSEKARQIAAAASQQAAGMKQMGDAMDHVVQGGRDTADGAKQLEAQVLSLSALARQLNDKVSAYQV